jgi:cyclopropane fatty-acyl-phospholipid synthase-like methyltransferase
MELVKSFYKRLPFNKSSNEEYRKSQLKPVPWKSLDCALNNSNTVLELGCGSGWLSHRIAYNYPSKRISAIDLIEENISIAKQQNSAINFSVKDLLLETRKADTVISVGVLHHIDKDIIKLMCHTINLSNKYTFIGLYHTHSRKAMFDFFERYPKHKHRKLFKKMMPHIKNDIQRESWFRDQLEHPFEQTVTLEQYKKVAEQTNTTLSFVNINTDDTYNKTMNRLESYEFTGGMIYGLFEKN